jgi:hypothetical protein
LAKSKLNTEKVSIFLSPDLLDELKKEANQKDRQKGAACSNLQEYTNSREIDDNKLPASQA